MSSAAGIRRSLFDRLLGTPEDVPNGVILTYSLEQLRDVVALDLEKLLNTRTATPHDALHLGVHARRSLLSFGIQDFSSRVLSSSEDQRHIARCLTQAIEIHEPRLRGVRVDFQDHAHKGSSLQFTIRAMLVVKPLHEGVSFDAVLTPQASRYQVRPSRFVRTA